MANFVKFEQQLVRIINSNSIENELDMPDYLIADLVVSVLKAIGPISKKNIIWNSPTEKDAENKDETLNREV